jgi:hypothetical protein
MAMRQQAPSKGFQMRLSLFFRFPLPFLLLTGFVYSQPSGGPYGPIDQRYEVPKAKTVYYVAPDGKSDSIGTELDHPTSLEAAIERVVTGDAIILRSGIYRTGGLVLNQGITMQPYEDEHPVLKGTQEATQWEVAQQRVENSLEASLSGSGFALVATTPRGNEDAAAPVQQRHGLHRRRASHFQRLGRRT